jgi:UDP-N-acetylglucosamine 1-carboxyvinyltransferase
VLIHQKMFESRLFFVDKLIDMGAQIILCDPHRAAVIGMAREHPLRGISMSSPDIRAGVALSDRRPQRGGKKHYPEYRTDRQGVPVYRPTATALGAQINRI